MVEVREARLPELDEAFAGHFGKFETVAAFEADVARRIRAGKQEERAAGSGSRRCSTSSPSATR